MDQAIKAKWVKALRSGKYQQGGGKLKKRSHIFHGQCEYCCLGVLRDVVDPQDRRSQKNSYLSDRQLREYGLNDRIQRELASMNDDDSVPFELIADVIEQTL